MDIIKDQSKDALLQFYLSNPDMVYQIGDWETAIACLNCKGVIEKTNNATYPQEYPDGNVDRKKMAQTDARCPHCLLIGKDEIKPGTSNIRVIHPIPNYTVWFRKLMIEPPTKKIKTWLGVKTIQQEPKFIKEFKK